MPNAFLPWHRVGDGESPDGKLGKRLAGTRRALSAIGS
jgi:hypothetical protein